MWKMMSQHDNKMSFRAHVWWTDICCVNYSFLLVESYLEVRIKLHQWDENRIVTWGKWCRYKTVIHSCTFALFGDISFFFISHTDVVMHQMIFFPNVFTSLYCKMERHVTVPYGSVPCGSCPEHWARRWPQVQVYFNQFCDDMFL